MLITPPEIAQKKGPTRTRIIFSKVVTNHVPDPSRFGADEDGMICSLLLLSTQWTGSRNGRIPHREQRTGGQTVPRKLPYKKLNPWINGKLSDPRSIHHTLRLWPINLRKVPGRSPR